MSDASHKSGIMYSEQSYTMIGDNRRKHLVHLADLGAYSSTYI